MVCYTLHNDFFYSMTYYLLPNTSHLLYKYIDCIQSEETPLPRLSYSLSTYLYDIKEKLDARDKDWDVFKRYTNPFEYIHTPVPYKKKSISKHKPLSRSYFKMIEMVNMFQLQFDARPIRTFHLAEGPGGFIEAMSHIRNCKTDSYIGMTILDDADPTIPAWKKTEYFLRDHPNVFIETGADGTGNIICLANFLHCSQRYASSMELITADGGFDFSMDFNNQEIHIAKLLFAQICFALTMQKAGGSFILKIFDSFMDHTVDLLYLLSSFYDKVYIIKPNTSRYANSEKYVVCKGFLYSTNTAYFPYLYKAFEKMCFEPIPPPPGFTVIEKYVHRFLRIPVAYFFVKKIEEYNAIFGQQQIDNIHFTILLIDNKHKQDKIDSLIKANVQKCTHWCNKNNVGFHMMTMEKNNVFMIAK